jgi:hypothetical protein
MKLVHIGYWAGDDRWPDALADDAVGVGRPQRQVPGGVFTHTELCDSTGQRVDPFGTPTSKGVQETTYLFEWDLP